MSAVAKFTSDAVDLSGHRREALALLEGAVYRDEELPPKVANFLGACCGYRTLTPRMRWWLTKLVNEAKPLNSERCH